MSSCLVLSKSSDYAQEKENLHVEPWSILDDIKITEVTSSDLEVTSSDLEVTSSDFEDPV